MTENSLPPVEAFLTRSLTEDAHAIAPHIFTTRFFNSAVSFSYAVSDASASSGG